MNRQQAAVIGLVLAVPLGLLGIWAFEGRSMKGDFIERLCADEVKGLHRDLRGKQWTPEELATVEVVKVPAVTAPQRALVQGIHSRGRIVVSPGEYEYQATVRDSAAGIIHVFGYCRSKPRCWRWACIHPDSMQRHLQRRREQLEEMNRQVHQQ